MYLPSRDQKYVGIGRLVSAVIGFALANGSPVFFTQILRVPLNGLTNAMNAPSGEICAPAISGSPKNSSRSIMGGLCAHTGAASATSNRVESISRPRNERREGINTSFVEWRLIRILIRVNTCLRTRTHQGFIWGLI